MKQASYAVGLLGLVALARAESTDTCPGTTTFEPITMTECDVNTIALGPTGTNLIYTTVYKDLCPTGLTSSTYTITKPCKSACEAPTPGEIPPGFTTKVVTCTTCGEAYITATITCPITALPAVATHPAGSEGGFGSEVGSGSKGGTGSEAPSGPGLPEGSNNSTSPTGSSTSPYTMVVVSSATHQGHADLIAGLLLATASFALRNLFSG